MAGSVLINTLAGPVDTDNVFPVGGTMTVGSITKPTALSFGKKTVTTAGTRVPLVASATLLTAGVVEIKALSTNTGIVYVGDNTVSSTNGHRLAAGESTILYIDDLNKINLDAATSGEGATFIGS